MLVNPPKIKQNRSPDLPPKSMVTFGANGYSSSHYSLIAG